MEKAILKTLAYADIFDYPLTLREIHKWLIGPPSLKLRRVNSQVTLRQIEKALRKLNQELRIKNQAGYYFLPRRHGLVGKRKRRERQSASYLRKAKILSQLLKLVPWIKLVGLSGGLALNNAGKKDDIDLFIITGKNRLWVSRILALGIISLLGQRRKKREKGRKIAGKLCINILLEEDRLEQIVKDIFVAHEVLQMKVLWQRDGMYTKYLQDNSWALRLLPNWVGSMENVSSSKYYVLREKTDKTRNSHNTQYIIRNTVIGIFEGLAKKFQQKIMQRPLGMERVEDGAVYFHPEDCRQKILSEYHRRIEKLATLDPSVNSGSRTVLISP